MRGLEIKERGRTEERGELPVKSDLQGFIGVLATKRCLVTAREATGQYLPAASSPLHELKRHQSFSPSLRLSLSPPPISLFYSVPLLWTFPPLAGEPSPRSSAD